MTNWIDTNGKKPEVDCDRVNIKYRDGTVILCAGPVQESEDADWAFEDAPYDPVAYAIPTAEELEGYEARNLESEALMAEIESTIQALVEKAQAHAEKWEDKNYDPVFPQLMASFSLSNSDGYRTQSFGYSERDLASIAQNLLSRAAKKGAGCVIEVSGNSLGDALASLVSTINAPKH